MAEPRHRENIQVFVRVRTINSKEKAENGYSVIDCCGTQEVVVRDSVTRAKLKTFTYDKVFNPKSKQFDVYKDVMQSHIEEVLSGYNCTVFAYGQTGTGKTYTMEGEKSSEVTNWQEDPKAGIIPRALSQIFDELQNKHSDYAIRVSFLELYNEELFDLLSPVDDTTKLRLFEDSSKKGSVIIKGLEEATVTNKDEVYKILEKGSAKRQTASTLMNAQSSRSHTIFSVTVHIREDDYVKVGKLNLVDLAGSENIGRSGAIDKRAREAGNINQSLLTLGRVITCLVERSPHIPYRESKLTRLLQDSLGGKTKTSIVATISPANTNIEETLSTLEYAHRAKNIQNKPEVNKVLTQKNILKEYNEQIERLKRDLKAVQDKSGIIISEENYQHMMQQIGSQEAELVEKMNEIKALEEERDRQSRIMEHFETLLKEKQAELESVNEVLIKTETVKKEITEQAKELQEVVKVTSKHTELLHDKLDRKAKLDLQNAEALAKYKSEFNKYFKELGKLHTAYSQADDALTEEQNKFLERLAEKDEEITKDSYQTCDAIEEKMTEAIYRIENLMTKNLNKSIDWMKILEETMQEVYERENNDFIMYIEQTAVPLVFTIIEFKEKMMADVSQLEAVNNDGIDTMQLDSDMKREMLAQLKDDQVAVKGAIDAVASQLITLQTKHHQLASNYDQQMMKTNQLLGAINESNKRRRQLDIDLVKQNSSLDEKEKCLIESFTNFSSFMEEKMASFGEMIEDAERHRKEKIEEAQRLCQEYETQIDDGRSLYMEDIVCYRRGIAEKLKSFTSSQADTISTSSQMISSIVSDGKSDLCELTAANEETKLLVDSVANKLHEFEEKLTAIQMLAQKSAEELVNMMKEHNSTLKETSEQEIKEIMDGFDSFSSSLTNFLKNKLLVTPASGDTPKREDILKITEEAGVEIDDVDSIPSTIGLRPPSQIQTFKEKENVKESKIGKANTAVPRTTRILEEINN